MIQHSVAAWATPLATHKGSHMKKKNKFTHFLSLNWDSSDQLIMNTHSYICIYCFSVCLRFKCDVCCLTPFRQAVNHVVLFIGHYIYMTQRFSQLPITTPGSSRFAFKQGLMHCWLSVWVLWRIKTSRMKFNPLSFSVSAILNQNVCDHHLFNNLINKVLFSF